NRHKAWMLRMEESHAAVGDRFAEDPAAARFGVYTLVNWLIALAAFVVLTLTVGWAWSWLAIVGGLAVMMILIARTLLARAAGRAVARGANAARATAGSSIARRGVRPSGWTGRHPARGRYGANRPAAPRPHRECGPRPACTPRP